MRALAGAIMSAALAMLGACESEPEGPPVFITRQSTGIEYHVIKAEQLGSSAIQRSKMFLEADAPRPKIPSRHVAVLTPFGCKGLPGTVKAFFEGADGNLLTQFFRKDARGKHEAILNDQAFGDVGVWAFADPALTMDVAQRAKAHCETWANGRVIMKPIFAVLLRVEDSTSDAAFYDRYVEDIVFTESEGDFLADALQTFVLGLILP